MPVTEHVVQLLQVIERGARRFDHVAPLVLPHVLFERRSCGPVEGMNCHRPGGLGGRKRLRHEGAFDEGSNASSVGMLRRSISSTI